MNETKVRRETDKQKYETMDGDLCMLCHAHGSDKRSLFIRTGYAMEEAVPEMIDTFLVSTLPEGLKGQYYLNICKACRGALLGHMREWANERRALRNTPKDHDGNVEYDYPEQNIPVRVDGTITMMTREQWEAWRANHG